MSRRFRRCPPAVLAGLAAVSWCVPALAGSFAEDGTFSLDPRAVVVLDFETPTDEIPTLPDEHALSGERVLTLASFASIEIPVTLPKTQASYRMTAWIRDGDAAPGMQIRYAGDDLVDEVAILYPTGRITSDGWVEMANDHLRVDGTRARSVGLTFFAPKGAKVDAVELVPDGDENDFPAFANASCDGATDTTSCAPGQICMWSECRNVNGWVPPIPEDRDDVHAYLESRLLYLFGPFVERELDLPASLVLLDRMATAQDAFSYWNAFMAAVRRLHDGHTGTSGVADVVVRGRRPINACFLEGDADLSHGVAPKDPEYLDVLVSHVGQSKLDLAPGDRLVRIDGRHPIAWARSLLETHWGMPGISNHTTFAELASALPGLISRYADKLEVVRCSPQKGTCGKVETIDVGKLPLDRLDPDALVTCDNRPLRHVAGAPKNHATGDKVYGGILQASSKQERIYGLEWESLYTSNGMDGIGESLTKAVETWRKDARGVLLDHRQGFGGTFLGPEILWNFAVERHVCDFYQDRRFGDEPMPTVEEGLAIFAESVADHTVQMCGGSAPADVPVALLLTEDVSASDWLPHGMKGAPRVRIFGPFQTNGGFSTRYTFGYWLGLNYVMAVGDDYLPDGTTQNGHGVEPDVVVLPLQSDLVAGKDTIFEAALAWLREEIAQ